jgi:hypothetical protein
MGTVLFTHFFFLIGGELRANQLTKANQYFRKPACLQSRNGVAGITGHGASNQARQHSELGEIYWGLPNY